MVIIIKKTDTISEIRKKIKPSKQQDQKRLFNAKKFNGAVKIKGNPVEIQKKLRND